MKKITFTLELVLLASLFATRADAQLNSGDVRLSLDTDVVGVAWVKTSPRSGGEDSKTVVGSVGPSQFGASQVGLPATPLGLGVGYVLRPKWLLGARAGLGFDVVSVDGHEDKRTYIAWTFMPGITYVPFGDRAKLFVNFSPLLEFVREKQGSSQALRFGGCYSTGAGAFFFMSPAASLDVGFFFEGRFPDIDEKPSGAKTDVSDLRWLVRLGISLWT
jgi:hypothetical protein